jgi:transcription initiation factor TFIIIB Brf1 subunit/transcription initiation factor TFIIB
MNLNKNTRDEAKKMYLQMDDHHREKKRPIRHRDALIPSVIYLACRSTDVAHTLKELCAHLDPAKVTKKDVGKTFKMCQDVLKLNIKPTKAKDLIERFYNLCFQRSNSANRSEKTKRGKCVLPL